MNKTIVTFIVAAFVVCTVLTMCDVTETFRMGKGNALVSVDFRKKFNSSNAKLTSVFSDSNIDYHVRQGSVQKGKGLKPGSRSLYIAEDSTLRNSDHLSVVSYHTIDRFMNDDVWSFKISGLRLQRDIPVNIPNGHMIDDHTYMHKEFLINAAMFEAAGREFYIRGPKGPGSTDPPYSTKVSSFDCGGVAARVGICRVYYIPGGKKTLHVKIWIDTFRENYHVRDANSDDATYSCSFELSSPDVDDSLQEPWLKFMWGADSVTVQTRYKTLSKEKVMTLEYQEKTLAYPANTFKSNGRFDIEQNVNIGVEFQKTSAKAQAQARLYSSSLGLTNEKYVNVLIKENGGMNQLGMIYNKKTRTTQIYFNQTHVGQCVIFPNRFEFDLSRLSLSTQGDGDIYCPHFKVYGSIINQRRLDKLSEPYLTKAEKRCLQSKRAALKDSENVQKQLKKQHKKDLRKTGNLHKRYVSKIQSSHGQELGRVHEELDAVTAQRDKLYQAELMEKEKKINELNSKGFNAERKVDHLKKTFRWFRKSNVVLISILAALIALLIGMGIMKFKGRDIKDMITRMRNKTAYTYSDKATGYDYKP